MYVLQRPIAYTHLLRPLMRLRAPSQASGILSLSSSQKDGKRKRGGQAQGTGLAMTRPEPWYHVWNLEQPGGRSTVNGNRRTVGKMSYGPNESKIKNVFTHTS